MCKIYFIYQPLLFSSAFHNQGYRCNIYKSKFQFPARLILTNNKDNTVVRFFLEKLFSRISIQPKNIKLFLNDDQFLIKMIFYSGKSLSGVKEIKLIRRLITKIQF
jgi:hypothetical protein